MTESSQATSPKPKNWFEKDVFWRWFFLASGVICIVASFWWASQLQQKVLDKQVISEDPYASNGVMIKKSVDRPSGYIEDVLQQQRAAFLKCYSLLLQKETTDDNSTTGLELNKVRSKAMVSLSFYVDPHGKVKEPSVLSSQLNDPAFHECLLEVLRRVEFKGFHGKESLQIIYPLQFQ